MGSDKVRGSGPVPAGPSSSGRLTVSVLVPRGGLSAAQSRHVASVVEALLVAGHDVGLRRLPHRARRAQGPEDVRLLVPGRDIRSFLLLTSALLERRSAGAAAQVLLVTDSGALTGRARVAVGRLVEAVDAVLVHDPADADAAKAMGARDVVVAPPPGSPPHTVLSGLDETGLDGDWASYVGAIETIAGMRSVAEGVPKQGEDRDSVGRALSERAAGATTAMATGAVSAARTVRSLTRSETDLGPRDLPGWVRPTDVLLTDDEAEDVVALARSLGLPWLPALPGSAGTDRRAAAWAALGALSAVLRVRDGERRSSLVVDAAGTSTVFSRWARAIGYAPVALRLSDPSIDGGSLDVVARLHPNGCTAEDVDLALAEAARLLRRGGLVSLTLPVHKPAGAPAPGRSAVSPADLRAVAARADAMGLALVGDLDRDIAPLLGELEPGADALARLTFRRR